jgi:predicted nucleic acid-binding protein
VERLRRGVFVDTSAWYALADAGDGRHETAVRWLRRLTATRRTLCTTNHITSESYTLIRGRLGARAALDFLRRMRDSRLVRRVHVAEEWESAAEALLAQFTDQSFSYVDATSFVTMRFLGVEQALAFDHHFVIAGFRLVSE